MSDFSPVEAKMRAAGVANAAIEAFRRNFGALVRQESGLIAEDAISPAQGLADWGKISASAALPDASLLGQVVVIKLNGGLGTSMGLQAAKSLLSVRDGATFLDIMVRQIQHLRAESGETVRLLLMNSFNTSEDTLAHLQRYRAEGFAEANEVELMQNQVPKLDAATLAPVSWPQDPELEWCPPGHGDLYPALVGSGWLQRLLDAGVRYAFVSNSDNLGAVMEPALLGYFAQSGAPFLMEVTRRTSADRKGGHLAVRKSDGQLLLREVAQCPPADLDAFQNIDRHQYFNTNNLWLRLDALHDLLEKRDGVLPLPMIVNRKTVDPRDKNSTAVIQLEVAMGAAIECFAGAAAIEVPRSRFAPVKTTADLFSLRSDAYEVGVDGRVMLRTERDGVPPDVVMDDGYKLVDSIEGMGMPSLIACDRLEIKGPVRFADGVVLQGRVSIENSGSAQTEVAPGTYRDTVLKMP
jgi:UTP--glucose-1-phosphate uridylyltransferase